MYKYIKEFKDMMDNGVRYYDNLCSLPNEFLNGLYKDICKLEDECSNLSGVVINGDVIINSGDTNICSDDNED